MSWPPFLLPCSLSVALMILVSARLLSSDEDEEDARILRRLEKRPEDPEEEIAVPEPNKRARSRSRSITPPPAVPAQALMTVRQTIR